MHGQAGFSYGGTTTSFGCGHKDGKVIYKTANGIEFMGSKNSGCEAIECTHVLDLYGQYPLSPNKTLFGDMEMVKKFLPFIIGVKKFPHPKVLRITWPDYSVPNIAVGFWPAYLDSIEAGSKILCTCMGGHGRTGTALACLMVASGMKASSAINLIRDKYCDQAVENIKQEDYVVSTYGEMLVASGMEAKEAEEEMAADVLLIKEKPKKEFGGKKDRLTKHGNGFKWKDTYKPTCPKCGNRAEAYFIEYDMTRDRSLRLMDCAPCELREPWWCDTVYGDLPCDVPYYNERVKAKNEKK